MSIWFGNPTLAEIAAMGAPSMVEHLGIAYTAITENSITAKMPVDQRTRQPFGLLHGGASVALAETLGSVAANLCVDPAHKVCVGLEINANHVRSVREGYIWGTTTPIHIGSSTQIWQIEIRDERGKLVCISRLTVAVLDRPQKS